MCGIIGEGLLLHEAAYHSNKETAELLLDKDADVNARDNGGETPLDLAIERKKTDTADLLRKYGGKTGAQLENAEPVAEAAQPEPPTAKAPDIPLWKAEVK